MSKQDWGTRDIAALRRFRKRFTSDGAAARDLGVGAVSVARWLNGDSPRYPEVVQVILTDRGCYQVRRAK